MDTTPQPSTVENDMNMIAPELDVSELQNRLAFLNVDFKYMIPKMEKEYLEIKRALPKTYNFKMRSELERLTSFLSLKPLSPWSPTKMASAGFFSTGLKDSIQCFCCGLIFCTTSLGRQPYEDHLKHRPDCKFIQGQEIGNIGKYEVRVQKAEENFVQNSEEYGSENARLDSFKQWPFYARIDPGVLAGAGFFFKGKRDTVECFSCGGCLGNWMEGDDPGKEHAKWFPECRFLKSMKSPDEIVEYIEDYCGFAGATGKHFTSFFNKMMLPQVEDDSTLNIFADERIRLESFKTWPQDAHADPSILAKVGFFYTGEFDNVECFSCGLCLHKFEPGDDPWTGHMKFNSECKYLRSQMPVKENETQAEYMSIKNLSQEKEGPSSTCKSAGNQPSPFDSGLTSSRKHWLQEAENLNKKMKTVYTEANFRKISSFGDSTHVSIDLNLLYGDLIIVSKDSKYQPLKKLTFPEILPQLDSITMIEGEAGSGKTALLRKIAVLWASGCCPMLNRFNLVFYLSLSSTEGEQGLADMIIQQLLKSPGALTDASLKEFIQQLDGQVLFLFDDYGETNPVPEIIGEIIHKNYINKLCLVFTARTHRGGKLRRFSKTVLSIMDFPLYSSIYLCRTLFSHNLPLVDRFLVTLAKSETFRGHLKTPTFTLALCVFWVQYPNGHILSETAICKAYLLYNRHRFPHATENVKALTSACGQLALKGLLQDCFEFSDNDLSEAGVSGDEMLQFGLLSKFTAQMLRPVYRFFHCSFQEHLAATRMSELLESDFEKDREEALTYLQHVDTFHKAAGRFHYFLKYACRTPKSTAMIIFHLFSLFDSSESFKCQSDNSNYLQQHPDLIHIESLVLTLSATFPETFHTYLIDWCLKFAIEVAHASDSMDICAPIIKQFIKGKSINFSILSLPNSPILEFLRGHPESLSLLASVQVSVRGTACKAESQVTDLTQTYSLWGIPKIEPEYSDAFTLLPKEGNISVADYPKSHPRCIPPFLMDNGHHRIPVLKMRFYYSVESLEYLLINLAVLLSVSDQVELELMYCNGCIDIIRPAIVRYKDSFIKFKADHVELSAEEQEVVLLMSSIETLEVDNSKFSQNQDHLFSHLYKFQQLKSLSVCLCREERENRKTLNCLKHVQRIETLKIVDANFSDDYSGLVECIKASKDLTVFHLKCAGFPLFESLVSAISSCKKLTELRLIGGCGPDCQLASLASVLPGFKMLKVLDLDGQYFFDKEASLKFAMSLASLVELEELLLPGGTGIAEAATTIVQQLQHVKNLKMLRFPSTSLDDSSLLELAMAAKKGFLQKTNILELRTIHAITEAGWRSFFETLDNMPALSELALSRLYTHQFKCHATTVKSFVQCVARLPSMTIIHMAGWLLDEDDRNMFNAMKEKHPQSKNLRLFWQWSLPFSPIVQE
ncbi:baculoviral IAP repeat-containing protein 1-like [Lissotriton helveticus]